MDNFNEFIEVGNCSGRTWRILGREMASFCELGGGGEPSRKAGMRGRAVSGEGGGSKKYHLKKKIADFRLRQIPGSQSF